MIGVDEHYDGGHCDEYALGSEYVRVLNMLELPMVVNKISHNTCLTEFGEFLGLSIS